MRSLCGSLQRFLSLAALTAILFAIFACSLFNLQGNNYTFVYRKVAAGVVNVTCTIFAGDLFVQPAGSGFIVDSQGHVVTNYHLVKAAQRIEVTLFDGSTWRARLRGADPLTNLAVVRIDAPPERLHPLPFGRSSDLQPGRRVLALGDPFGEGDTLSAGIISAVERLAVLRAEGFATPLIQTDATINASNTGGPLVDMEGKVLGVNTAIAPGLGGDTGTGYAVPIDLAERVITDLIKKGYASHPWIGASLVELNPDVAKASGLKVRKGVLVKEVFPGGPADLAGLRGAHQTLQLGGGMLPWGGDIVVAFDGKRVKSVEGFYRLLMKKRPGDRITLKVLREGRLIDLVIVLDEMPPL